MITTEKRSHALRSSTLGIIFFAVAVLLHAPGFTSTVFNSDEAFLATEAQVLEAGGDLYHDVVDRKPPLVPLLYESVFDATGSSALWSVRVAAVVSLALTALLLAAEARRRWGGRTDLWAGLLFLASSAALPPPDAQAANFEIFMLPTMVAAMLLGARLRPGSSGVLIALSTLTKQTAAATLVPLALLAWRADRGRGIARLMLGFVAPIMIAALWFGPRDFLFWNYLAAGDYLDVSGVLGFTLGLGVTRTLVFVVTNAAIVALVASRARRWREDADLWLWILSAAVGVAAGLRFFEHYYLQLIPALCLLAARPLDELSPRLADLSLATVAATTLWFNGSAVTFAAAQNDERLDRVSTWVARRTLPHERILVWGHWPELYWRADRRPATRFVTTGFLTGHSGGRPPDRVGLKYATTGAWAAFEDDLEAHPPVLVVDVSPADLRNARHYPPSRFPRFGERLARDYVLVTRIEGVDIYAPRP